MTRFSQRTGWSRRPSQLARLVAAARDSERVLVDLTQSNPTAVAFDESRRRRWVSRMGDPGGAGYAPDARGLLEAREAVADYYARRGCSVDPGQVRLTASSSEAYAWLFKLVGDAGDVVLAPEPSYPLFPFLAGLEQIRLVPYPLLREEGWRIDVGALRRQLDAEPRARAILLVHPANPTGSLVHPDDAAELAELAREHELTLIVDEVFLDYLAPKTRGRRASFAGFGREHDVLCVVLSGLSKVALLPQVKLGWMVLDGAAGLQSEALARLELVADSYLSVSTAVQLAAPTILGEVDAMQPALIDRLEHNLAALDVALAAQGPSNPVRRLVREGGWYAMLEVPRTRDDDGWIERLLTLDGLIVHPGYFFDAAEAGLVVVSLLLEPARFRDAIERCVTRLAAG
jgi:alanine-synthesizing transaminase